METKFSKNDISKKIFLILISILAFLVFSYYCGNLRWMSEFQLFLDLLASIFAFFIGVLALVRFYTKKNNLNLLFIGLGFLTVGVVEVIQIFGSLETFSQLFVSGSSEVFPATVVISRVFLSLLLLASWLFLKDERKKILSEKLAFVGVVLVLTVLVVYLSLYSQIFSNVAEYMFAIMGHTIAMLLFLLTFLGYIRSKGIHYRNFDFWVIFSLVFSVISQIFFLPYLNLEYQLMLNLGTLAKFISYFVLLVGFLYSIYEMYKREEEYQKELERKNVILAKTKAKVEEAYMLLRSEKWQLTKEKEKNTADRIMKDILKNT